MNCNNNMYNDYDDEIFNYYTTSTFDNRTKKYLLSRYTPTAEWDYGDIVEITFNLYDNDNTSEIEELQGKDILIQFYNDRYEELPFEAQFERNGDNQEFLKVTIDYETSNKYFERGTYHCSVKLVEYGEDNIPTYLQTVLAMDNCLLYVN